LKIRIDKTQKTKQSPIIMMIMASSGNRVTLEQAMAKIGNDCDYLSWVFIWKMTPEKVGHVALQVGGCQPKMTEESKNGIYVSLHPSKIPALGPTIVLPLPSHISRSLVEDMEIEASYVTSSISPDAIAFSEPTPTPTSLPPDTIYKVTNLQTDKMRNAIKDIENKHDEGMIAYQLCPQPDTAGFFLDIPSFLTYDAHESTYVNSKQSINYLGKSRFNCATMVSSILSSGGLVLKHTMLPWGLTPNEVTEQLGNLEATPTVPGKVSALNVRNLYFKR
jgi:hypothetical protein